MRSIVGVVLLASAVVLAGCDSFRHSEVKATFLNATDTLLCDSYGRPVGPQGPCAGRAGEAIKPHERRTRLPGCGYGADDEDFDLTVVLVVASDGRVIYNRTANCKEWDDAHATFIIKQRGDDFVVTDSLSDNGSRP